MKRFLISILTLSIILITGCSNKDANESQESTDTIQQLLEHKETKLGDNSAVSSIISILPGGDMYKEIEIINGNKLRVAYGLKENSSISKDQFADYWLKKDTIKKNFLYNALAAFILIDNLDEVQFEVEAPKENRISFKRKQLEKKLPHSFIEYQKNKNLWENDLVDNLVKSDKKRNKFYQDMSSKK
ncbi:DUF4825 domain-containing protein [Bacillus sp. 179-C3.3 HS]|uniref:DUF4825 domain-containing protein n=1 Tax=Bacillus sp. 179-C3.3 HS TaxID=3232162 RepID=UPI0039A1D3F9